MTAKLEAIRGSIPPIITPFRGDQIDYDAYGKLIERQVAEGSHGVLVNGTTSEPATLTVEERNRMVDIAIAAVGGRVPVVVAAGSQSHAETIALTEHATKAGADALLTVTPYYTRPPQRGLVEYYCDLGKRSPLPLMIYHIPGRTAVSVTLDTLKAIKDRTPHLVGIKHAVNDLAFVADMIHELGKDWKVFAGLEELSYPIMAIGGCGTMNAVGNLAPKRVSELCEAVWKNDLAEACRLHYSLLELNQAVFFDTNPIAIKYMMKRMGIIPQNDHRLPMAPATPELEKRLDGVLQRAGLV